MNVSKAIEGLKGYSKSWDAGGAGDNELTREIRAVLDALAAILSERDGPGGYVETVTRLRTENEGLREALVSLLEDAEDMRRYADDWTWKYGKGWDETLAKAREIIAAR